MSELPIRPSQAASTPHGESIADPDRDPLEALAEEFAARHRRGERVSIDEYAARFPNLAEDIRELFPAVLAMEKLNHVRQSTGDRWRSTTPVRLEQLGDFRVIREIGRGGMGIVYEAEQVSLGRHVAVKVLPSQLLRNDRDVQRFQREAQTAARLHHSNIVPVFGAGQQDGTHYIVMQLIQGVGLDEILSELRQLARPRAERSAGASSPGTSAVTTGSTRLGRVHRRTLHLLHNELRRTGVAVPEAEIDTAGLASRATRPSTWWRTLRRRDQPQQPGLGEPTSPNSTATSRSGADQESSALGYELHSSITNASRPEPLGVGNVESSPPPGTLASQSGSATRPASLLSLLRFAQAGTSHPLDTLGSAEYYRNVAQIGRQAAQALSYAHRHETLHRDVKPGNLLLDDEGVVWVVDFGLAKAVEHHDVTWTGDIVGTLSYMAPERFHGEESTASDIYSLGLTLYELVTLQRAYDGRDRVSIMHRVTHEEFPAPSARNPQVPADLETIILKAAARLPSDRYASAAELADDLQAFLEDRPIQARRPSLAEQGWRWCRRNRAIASLAATVCALIGTVFSVTVAGYVREATQRQRAESTSRLAVTALDQIYGQFAPMQWEGPVAADVGQDDEQNLWRRTQLPLSKDVAQVLENLLGFYDELSQQAEDSSELAVKSIAANRRVGDIHRRLGEYDLAKAAYERASNRLDVLDPEVRIQEAVRLEAARVYNGLGMVYDENQAAKLAVDAHRRAITVIGNSPGSPTQQFERASSLYLLHIASQHALCGAPHPNSPSPDAWPVMQAIAILSELQTRYPSVPDYRFLLARCLLASESVVNESPASGALIDAEQRALDMLEEVVSSSPEVPDYRYELGRAYASTEWPRLRNKFVDCLPADALAHVEKRLRRALAVTDSLDTDHPHIPQYHVLRKELYHALALALQQQQKPEEAEQYYQAAIEKQQMVVRQAREPELHRVWEYQLRLSHAQLYRDLGRDAESRAELETVATALEKLLGEPQIQAQQCSRRVCERTLVKTYATLSSVLRDLGETELANQIVRRIEDPVR